MGSIAILGIGICITGLLLLFMGNRSRGQMSGSYGKAQGAFKGPVWFLLMVIGIFLIVIDSFLPF